MNRQKKQRLTPRVKVWIELEGEYVFGQGLAEILEAVEVAGSLKQAAMDLGKSYRHVWGRVKEAEAAFGQQFVEARVGGQGTQRSVLTPLAKQLLQDFSRLRTRMHQILKEEFSARF